MSRTLTIQSKSARSEQDSTLDRSVIDKTPRRKPLSLRPGQTVMDGCVEGQRHALAIRDAWRPNHRVTIMQPGEFDALTERCLTDFHGLDSDINEGAIIRHAKETEADCA